MTSESILPPKLLADPNYRALEQLLQLWSKRIDFTKLLIYWLDIVDASVLPHLAEQFHVLGLEGWDYATTEQEKRDLLKQAVELHRYKGTPWAVRQGLKRINPDLDIQEWFEYGGEPYYFKLTGNIKITLAQAVKLFYTIEALKSLRSHLEGGIEAQDVLESELKSAAAVIMQIIKEITANKADNPGSVILVGGHTPAEISNIERFNLSPYIPIKKLFIGTLTRIEVNA